MAAGAVERDRARPPGGARRAFGAAAIEIRLAPVARAVGARGLGLAMQAVPRVGAIPGGAIPGREAIASGPARRARGAAAVDVALAAVDDVVGAGRGARALSRADRAQAIGPRGAVLSRHAWPARAAAVEIGLVAVLGAVRARRRLARHRPDRSAADVARAVGGAETGLSGPARGAPSAAIDPRLRAIADTVRACGRGAGPRAADGGGAVVPPGAVGAGRAGGAGAAAVDVGLGAVLLRVEARGRLADAAIAIVAYAVTVPAAPFAGRASAAGATAVDVRLGAVPVSVVAGGGDAVMGDVA